MEYNVVLPRKGSRPEVISTTITNQNTWFVERSSLMRKKCGFTISRSAKYKFLTGIYEGCKLQGRVFFDVPGSYIYLNCILSNIFSIVLYCSIPLKMLIIINSGLLP